MSTKDTLALRVKRFRIAAKLTQPELAARAKIDVSTLRGIERGRITNPGMLTIDGLATGLDKTSDQLLGRSAARKA